MKFFLREIIIDRSRQANHITGEAEGKRVSKMGKIQEKVCGFFGKIFFIFRHDMKRLFMNPIAAILAAGLMVLPSLYAWFNIEASWDPYGNTGNLKVAVANCDEGYSLKGMTVNVGNSIVDSLAGNDEIGWLFMEETDAVEGVKSGAYYAAIVIPEDFSRDMMSILTPDMVRPDLKYYVNEKTNAIAPKITGTAMSTVQQQVNESFINQGITVLCDTIQNLYEAYVNADFPKASDVDAEGALQDTIGILNDLSGNLTEMETVIGVFQNTSDTIDSLLGMIQETLNLVEKDLSGGSGISGAIPESGLGNSLTEMLDSLEVLMNAASGLADGMYDMTDGLAETIEQGGAEGAAAAENIAGMLKKNGQILQKTEKVFRNLESVFRKPIEDGKVTEAMKITVPSLKNPGETITLSLYDSLEDTADSLEKIVSRLVSAENSVKSAEDALHDMADRLKNGGSVTGEEIRAVREEIRQGGSRLVSAAEEFDDTARDGIENGMAYFADAADSLSAAGDHLTSVFPYLDVTITGSRNALHSAGDAMNGTVTLLENLNGTLDHTIGNLEELREDIREIQSSVNIRTLLEDALGIDFDDYAGSTQELAEFLSSPVLLDTQTLYPIENYGSSMTPFYTILAIWVGCLLLVSIFKVNVRESRDLQLNQFQHYHLYLGRYLLFLTFSIVQALIMCLGDLYLLEIQCPAPGRFILTGILAAVTFSNIVYTLTISLGDVGKAAAIVLLIIQVAGAGGTFPVELTPSFFNELNPFMPFTHGINAMRECIGGFYGSNYVTSLIKMCVYLPVFLLFGTVFRKPLIRMMNFFHRKLDETGLM